MKLAKRIALINVSWSLNTHLLCLYLNLLMSEAPESAGGLCRLLSLRVLEPAKIARDWADLQAAAAQAPKQLRSAMLLALHPRCCF